MCEAADAGGPGARQMASGGDPPGPSDAFVRRLTAEQSHLLGYITTLMGGLGETADILQQTNVVLWRKHGAFDPRTSFRAWARKVAYYQTLSYLRDRKRDRHVFDDELLEEVASRPFELNDDGRSAALHRCLAGLPARSAAMIRKRYTPGESIASIAAERGVSEGSVRMSLMRIRKRLMECIERRLANAK